MAEKVTLERDGQKVTTSKPTTITQLKAEGWKVKRTVSDDKSKGSK